MRSLPTAAKLLSSEDVTYAEYQTMDMAQEFNPTNKLRGL
jgi:hypothetical protein